MRVRSVDGPTALCERDGASVRLDAQLVGALRPGDHVLAFQGRAVRVLDPTEAAQTDAALAALAAVMQGADDIDRHFADLVDRVPELPAHLRKDP
jgi:hydrogenase expression/formation protein HypC